MSTTLQDKASHSIILASLLHDIGKVLLRLDMSGKNKGSNLIGEVFGREYADLFENCLNYLAERGKRHEDYNVCLVRLFKKYIGGENKLYKLLDETENILYMLRRGQGQEASTWIVDAIKSSDIVTASERSIVEEKDIYEKLHHIHGFKHYESPFTSPLWLYSLKKNDKAFGEFIKYSKKLSESMENPDTILRELKRILEDNGVLGENSKPFHIDPVVIKWGEMKKWKIIKAVKSQDKYQIEPPEKYQFKSLGRIDEIDYSEVVVEFLKASKKLLELVKNNIIDSKGFLETMLTIMKYTLFFVPAGVYGSIMPDTSLYAHSKATAAIAHAYMVSDENRRRPGSGRGFKLLMVDIDGIQEFIKKIAQNKAAAKMLRGKSLLVELLQRAIATYILEELGLTWTNIIGYEGGVITIIIPSVDERTLRRLVDDVERRVEEEFGDELGVTVAYSPEITKPITLEQVLSLAQGNLSELEPGTYAYALIEVHKRLLKRKYQKRYSTRILDDDYIFDRLTHQPVSAGKYYEVTDENNEYFNSELAPNAFTPTGVELYYSPRRDRIVSKLTHKALVAGSVARNLVAIIQVKAKSSIEGLRDRMVSTLNNMADKHGDYRMYWTIYDRNLGISLRIGIVEFPSLNQLFILIAVDEVMGNPWRPLYSFISVLFSGSLRNTVIGGAEEIRIIIVNAVEEMLNVSDSVLNILRNMGSSVSVSLDYWFTNTMHPTVTKDNRVKIADIDELFESERGPRLSVAKLLAVAKMDGDHLGEVVRLLSASPTRFITVSELLQFYFGGLSYALLESRIPWISESNILRYGDLIVVLFGGGDDIALYGHWLPLLHYVSVLREGMDKVLYPLTASTGVAADHYKVPIAMLYDDALRLLTVAKSEGRNRITLFDDTLPHIEEYDKNSFIETIVKYSTKYNRLGETIEEAMENRERIQLGTIYSLYAIAVRISELLRRQAVTVNEKVINAIRLQYDYYRVLRYKREDLDRIEIIKQVLDLLEQSRLIEALLELNTKLPLLAIVVKILQRR